MTRDPQKVAVNVMSEIFNFYRCAPFWQEVGKKGRMIKKKRGKRGQMIY